MDPIQLKWYRWYKVKFDGCRSFALQRQNGTHSYVLTKGAQDVVIEALRRRGYKEEWAKTGETQKA